MGRDIEYCVNALFPELIYRFSTILVKIPREYFVELD